MTSNVENLLLEHLKRFQAGQDRIERDLREIKTRLSALESGQASILQHIMSDRIDRIEHRLELA